jgi:hypothetical protein
MGERIVDGVGDFAAELVDAVIVSGVIPGEVLNHPCEMRNLLPHDGNVHRSDTA